MLLTVNSPDGKLIARPLRSRGLGGSSRSKEFATSAVVIREAASGRAIHTLTGHSADVVSLAFSPDGRRLATASYDRTIKLWDTSTGQDVFTLRGHTAGVVAVAFSPDGNLIVSGGIDDTARVWNATPLAANLIAEHDTRYLKKIAMLRAIERHDGRCPARSGPGQQRPVGHGRRRLRQGCRTGAGQLILRYHHMLCLLENGDIPGYRRAAVDLLTRFGKVTSPNEADNAAWYCVLAADALPDLNAPVRMAETALAACRPEPETSRPQHPGRRALSCRPVRRGHSTTGGERPGAREVSEIPRTGLSWPWPIGRRGMARPPAVGSTSFDPTIRARAAGFSPEAVEIGILRREAEALVHDSPPARP